VEYDSQGEQIRAGIKILASDLFRRHVGDSIEHSARLVRWSGSFVSVTVVASNLLVG